MKSAYKFNFIMWYTHTFIQGFIYGSKAYYGMPNTVIAIWFSSAFVVLYGILWVIETEDVPEDGHWVENKDLDLVVGDEVIVTQNLNLTSEPSIEICKDAFVYKVKDNLVYLVQHGCFYQKSDNNGDAEITTL